MSRKSCSDCGTGLERSGVCPNCDEAAFINEFQGDFLPAMISEDFAREISEGNQRAQDRLTNECDCKAFS